MEITVAVLGLGYVGLPLALGIARSGIKTIGFDINKEKVAMLQRGEDPNDEGREEDIRSTKMLLTADAADLRKANFYITCAPTPIDEHRRPDLTPLLSICEAVGPYLKKGDIVVFESTVYPGVTEDYCGAELERISGLRCGVDFKLGYSPERINPGDHEHTIERIVKVISAQDEESLAALEKVYGSVVKAGLHKAPSIRVAEAAKVIENTQRDLNIALMNELSIIFNLMGIRTADVLAAAGTKWNFLKFTPGLVGGHCIGVDPYYLTSKAEQLGYHPQIILAGRRINDGMGAHVAQQVVKNLAQQGQVIKGSRIGILGVTFKEDVIDVRNSRIPDIVNELKQFGVEVIVTDPRASSDEVKHEYGFALTDIKKFADLDGLILAVAHKEYRQLSVAQLEEMIKDHGVFVDLKSIFHPSQCSSRVAYWSL